MAVLCVALQGLVIMDRRRLNASATGWGSLFFVMVLAAVITLSVYRHAWICEDSFITLRYVRNTLDGHGAVFNPEIGRAHV